MLMVVEACQNFAEDLKAEKKIPATALQNIVDFFRVYGNLRHHREEQWLLSLLKEKDLVSDGCPIDVLREEHQKIMALVEELAKAVSLCAKSDGAVVNGVAETLHSLADRYSSHIWKEDNILLPFADQSLSVVEQQRLAEVFYMVTSGREEDAARAQEQVSESIRDWERSENNDKRSRWLAAL